MLDVKSNINLLTIQKELQAKTTQSPSERKFIQAMDKLIVLIKSALTSSNDFSIDAYPLFNEMFTARTLALEWVVENKIIVDQLHSNLLTEFDYESTNEVLAVLIENAQFTIRTQLRIQKRMSKQMDTISLDRLETMSNLPRTSYDFSINVLKNIPNIPNDIRKALIGFVSCSLMSEISLIATQLVFLSGAGLYEEKKVEQIATTLAENTRHYGDYAIQLGVFDNKRQVPIGTPDMDTQFDHELAEQGMGSYAERLMNE